VSKGWMEYIVSVSTSKQPRFKRVGPWIFQFYPSFTEPKNSSKTIEDLIRCVKNSFIHLEPNTLSDVFLSLQLVMEQILDCGGGKKYKLLHISKNKLRSEGSLQESIRCTEKVIDLAKP
jgi:hypothetical protein